MFQRLWVRLSVAFAAIMAIFVVVVVALFFFFSDSRNLIRESIIAYIDGSQIPQQLVSLYERDQSWQPVIGWLRGIEANIWLVTDAPTNLILADASGQVIYSSLGIASDTLSSGQRERAVTLRQGDTILGYVEVDLSEWRPNATAQALFIEQMRRVISVLMIVASLFGIVLGMVVSRVLTAPLERLAAWAVHVRDRQAGEALALDGSIEITTLAQAINEMVDALQTSEQLRRSLVADVAHELRTPLTVLQGNLYAILDDVYPCNKPQVAALYDQTRVLNRLVSDLHDLSQVEANPTQMQMQTVRLNRLIEDAVEQFQFQAEQKAITLHLTLPDHLPTLPGDPDRLAQVLNNLLTNAVRHSPANKRIDITAGANAQQVTVTVSNTGTEIPPEHLPHIFERFYRVDRARDRSAGGAGLGLAIARAIVEAHNGSISVATDSHRTSFTVVLPLTTAEQRGKVMEKQALQR